MLQANNNRPRSDCAVKTANLSVEFITDKPISGKISLLQQVSVAEQAGLTLIWSQTQYLCQHACISTLHDISRCLLSITFKDIFQVYVRISGIMKTYQNFGPDLSPDCLLKFSVVLPSAVIEQPNIKENRPGVFHQVACVASEAITRENAHDI